MVNGMTETESFLIKFYGPNYMTPPPLDKRTQHNANIFSVTKFTIEYSFIIF